MNKVLTIIIIFFISCNNKEEQARSEEIKINNKIDSIKELINQNTSIPNFNEAIKLASIGLEIDPNNLKMLGSRALSYQNNNQLEKAIADYTQLINLEGNNDKSSSYFRRGECKYALNDLIGALPDLDYCVNNNYALLNSYLLRGMINLDLNNKSQACLDFSKAGESGNENAYYCINRYCQ